MFWVGAWDLVDDSRDNGGLLQPQTPMLFPGDDDAAFYGKDLPLREYIYVVSGLLMLIGTDTLYANAGMDGNYFQPQALSHMCIRSTFRLAVGMFGSLLLWNGLYDLHWRVWFTPSVLVMCLSLIAGLVLLSLTGTFWGMAYIDPTWDQEAQEPEGDIDNNSCNENDGSSFCLKHAKQTLLAFPLWGGRNE